MSYISRISRIIRAEQTFRKQQQENFNFSPPLNNSLNINAAQGTALTLGGTIAGASLGNIGILAAGTGYSIGAVPLAAIGTLTGAALYETLRSLIEGDPRSLGAAATGAVVGAATSATIGGVGVAVGGSAFGVGMVSMAVGGAVFGLGFAGLYHLLKQGFDPENLLDRAIDELETELRQLRQAIINLRVSQTQLEHESERLQRTIYQYHQQAIIALKQGNDDQARAALIRKKNASVMQDQLKKQLDLGAELLNNLKQNFSALAAKHSEAKQHATILKAEMMLAKADFYLSDAWLMSQSL